MLLNVEKSIEAFVFGAVLGGVLGSLTALLLAPSSGEELRSNIQSQVDQIQVEMRAVFDELGGENHGRRKVAHKGLPIFASPP